MGFGDMKYYSDVTFLLQFYEKFTKKIKCDIIVI